jgi:hypothetical protein
MIILLKLLKKVFINKVCIVFMNIKENEIK